MVKVFTKDQLIADLRDIRSRGYIPSIRNTPDRNDGAVGNTLEFLLEIEENNLAIFNAGEWEIKSKRKSSNSLTTLFHKEPSPLNVKFVPNIFLPNYGWKHQEAGKKYPETEMSFRQTLNGNTATDRGFKIIINDIEEKLEIAFDSSLVSPRHRSWLNSIESRAGHLLDLNPRPYWGFNDVIHTLGAKLHNVFYVEAEVKRINGHEHFHFTDIYMLSGIAISGFVNAIRNGHILIDFDARSGHNHGTKFRIKKSKIKELYLNKTQL